jgi:hypothetical protein
VTLAEIRSNCVAIRLSLPAEMFRSRDQQAIAILAGSMIVLADELERAQEAAEAAHRAADAASGRTS